MRDLLSMNQTMESFEAGEFQRTDTLLQPAYTWIWNAPVTREGIAQRLEEMARAGIRTIYVLPEPKEFRAYTQRMHLEPEYLSDEFFHLLRWMADYALELGMSLWLYDEGGWPSGSACGQVRKKRPDLCRKTLDTRRVFLKSGETYRPGERALAAFRPGGGREMVKPGDAVGEDTELTEYYVRWCGVLEVDSLDEDIGREFVESTHERYARFFSDLFGEKDEAGRRIVGSGRVQMMFTDEPSAGRNAWPRGFEDRFMERYGYNIRPYLPDLMDLSAEADEQAVRARVDYRALTGEMFRDNYFKPLREWARRNHLLSGGHLDIDHQSDGCVYHHYGTVLQQLREMDVPGVDAIWRQITRPSDDGAMADLSRQNTPSDRAAAAGKACGEGNGFFPRFASSAAAQGGNKFALSESFAVYGAGLDGDEMRYAVNFQLARGVNLFNFMIMSYQREGAAGLVMRPDFVPEMPGYNHLRAVNDYTARACYLMQLGRPGADTALYYPARDIWAGGETARRAVRAFDEMGRALEARQVDFDIIDDDAVRMAQIGGGEMSLGLARYAHALIPDCRHMPDDVKARLEKMDHSICPALETDCPSLRVRRRLLPGGGTLWALFNESDKAVTAAVRLPGGSVCRLDADRATVERADGLEEIALLGGEARFYLCADEEAAGAQDAPRGREELAVATEFTLRGLRETIIDDTGLHSRAMSAEAVSCKAGSWAGVMGGDFSGEAVYRTQVELPRTPRAGETYEIDLGRVECGARVAVNGKEIGTAWHYPMRLTFDGEALEGNRRAVVEIEVANTMANQCVAKPLKELFPEEELGQYQDRIGAFEKMAPGGGLYGPVIVSRLLFDGGNEYGQAILDSGAEKPL